MLAAMRRHNASLEELTESMQMLPQVLINVRFEGNSDPLASQLVQDAQAQVESQLGERGRVLLRKSGTEPLIRVMVEGDDEAQVRAHAESIATAVKQAV